MSDFKIRTSLRVDDEEDELWNSASAAVFASQRTNSLPSPAGQRAPALQLRAHELASATSGFSPKYLIASGTYGQVFVAKLPSLPLAGPCAIKRVQPDAGEDVSAEVELLSKCNHANVLPLIGYSLGQMACMVFPLMSGGTLEDRVLRSPDGEERLRALGHATSPPALTWWERVRILRDAARGLVYLHTVCKTLHSDVKPSNILLDKRLNARLADFGLAAALQPPAPSAPSGASQSRSGSGPTSLAASPPHVPKAGPPQTPPDSRVLNSGVLNGGVLSTDSVVYTESPVYDDLPSPPLPARPQHQTQSALGLSPPWSAGGSAPVTPPRANADAPTEWLADSLGAVALDTHVDLRLQHRFFDDLPCTSQAASAEPSRSTPPRSPPRRIQLSPQPRSASSSARSGAPASPKLVALPVALPEALPPTSTPNLGEVDLRLHHRLYVMLARPLPSSTSLGLTCLTLAWPPLATLPRPPHPPLSLPTLPRPNST